MYAVVAQQCGVDKKVGGGKRVAEAHHRSCAERPSAQVVQLLECGDVEAGVSINLRVVGVADTAVDFAQRDRGDVDVGIVPVGVDV